MEITYYDSRPKPEKPVVKAKQMPPGDMAIPRDPLNRRPLPSNPVMGKPTTPSVPEHVQTPPRPQPNPPTSYLPSQSPLQAVEYNTPPPPAHREYAPAAPSNGYVTPSREPPRQNYRPAVERHDKYAVPSIEQDFSSPDFQDYDRRDSEPHYDDGPIPLELPDIDGYREVSPDDDRPPPPPVHRSLHTTPAPPESLLRNSFDTSPTKGTPLTMRHDVLRNEAHRHSTTSTYPGRPTYRPYDSSPAAVNPTQHSTPESHHPSPPRHHSYDSSFDAHPRSMHSPTEDSPEPLNQLVPVSFRHSASPAPLYEREEAHMNQVPSPAPLNLGGRGSAASGHYGPGTSSSHRRQDSYVFRDPSPPATSRDYHRTSPSPAVYEAQGSEPFPYRHEYDDIQPERRPTYTLPALPALPAALPPVPASLVPGVDPGLALEISSRIHDERRQERRQTMPMPTTATPPRGRQMLIEAPPTYGQDSSPQSYGTPQHSYDRGPVTYSGGPSSSVTKPRALSPRPSEPSPTAHHTIKRKSISPAPPPDPRRLSGVPFGPDSYDLLNPSVVSTSSRESGKSNYNETNGKIITHDGKEVDPSDHLPMETWAPEPEPKQPLGHAAGGPGKMQLRLAARPQSTGGAQYISSERDSTSPTMPTARNRLQKKTNRQSAMPIMTSSTGSSPLAPLSQPHHPDNHTPPRGLPRANTFDSENHAPAIYHGSPSGRGTVSAPPIPAKVPIGGGRSSGTMMTGALPAPHHGRHGHHSNPGSWNSRTGPQGGHYGGHVSHGGSFGSTGGGSELSLAEEISRIDLGTGRARRHQARY